MNFNNKKNSVSDRTLKWKKKSCLVLKIWVEIHEGQDQTSVLLLTCAVHSPSKCLAWVKNCHQVWLNQNFDPSLLTNNCDMFSWDWSKKNNWQNPDQNSDRQRLTKILTRNATPDQYLIRLNFDSTPNSTPNSSLKRKFEKYDTVQSSI